MKLAEILIERAEINSKISEVKSTIIANAKVQEGDEDNVDLKNQFALFNKLNNRLTEIINIINTTNYQTVLENGMRLIDAIVSKENLKAKIDFYKEITKLANQKDFRYTRSEIKTVLCINMNDIIKTIDKLSKEYRILDSLIQKTNWTVDV